MKLATGPRPGVLTPRWISEEFEDYGATERIALGFAELRDDFKGSYRTASLG
jgi:hypothetical protein